MFLNRAASMFNDVDKLSDDSPEPPVAAAAKAKTKAKAKAKGKAESDGSRKRPAKRNTPEDDTPPEPTAKSSAQKPVLETEEKPKAKSSKKKTEDGQEREAAPKAKAGMKRPAKKEKPLRVWKYVYPNGLWAFKSNLTGKEVLRVPSSEIICFCQHSSGMSGWPCRSSQMIESPKRG